jgi:hypothetical protein
MSVHGKKALRSMSVHTHRHAQGGAEYQFRLPTADATKAVEVSVSTISRVAVMHLNQP